MNYKKTKTYEERKKESDDISEKYPDRVPCIIEKLTNDHDTLIPEIDKNKYLVPKDLNIGQLMYVIRKRIKITPEKALFIFCNGKVLQGSQTIDTLYDSNKDKDGFLYLIYSGEATFGFSK